MFRRRGEFGRRGIAVDRGILVIDGEVDVVVPMGGDDPAVEAVGRRR